MTPPIQIVIADDRPIFRKGLVEVIAEDGRFAVLGEAADGDRAQELVQKLHPQVAVLDVDMPKMNGLALAERLRVLVPSVALIILTSYKEETIFNRALDLGVKGFVLKENAVTDILRALETVAQGGTFLSPSISAYLVNRVRRAEASLWTLIAQITANADLRVYQELKELDSSMRPETGIHLYRIIESLLENVVQHARASTLLLELRCEARQIVLRVEDDGVGLTANAASPGGGAGGGLRIAGERAMLMGGGFPVKSEPGTGTCVRVMRAPHLRVIAART